MTDESKDQDQDQAIGMTPMREAAIQAHELYLAFREGGFTRRQSMDLVAKIIATMMVTAASEATETKPHD